MGSNGWILILISLTVSMMCDRFLTLLSNVWLMYFIFLSIVKTYPAHRTAVFACGSLVMPRRLHHTVHLGLIRE